MPGAPLGELEGLHSLSDGASPHPPIQLLASTKFREFKGPGPWQKGQDIGVPEHLGELSAKRLLSPLLHGSL